MKEGIEVTDKQKRLHLLHSRLCNELSYSSFPNIFEMPCAIIKGEPLSALAYMKTGQRICTDIDILIPRKQLNDVKKMLFASGFKQQTINRADEIVMLAMSHQTPSFYREIPPIGLTKIDLNFDMFWGEYEGKRIDIEEFLSDTIEMEIYGVKIKTLTPLKTMIQVILHHYKDMNSIFLLATRKSIKYEMFKDIYYLLKNNLNSIVLEKLYEISAEYDIIPYVFYVLYYTGQIFDDKFLEPYIEAFRTPEGEAFLNCYGLCVKERKEWKCDFKTRLESDNLYELIKDDLTERDREKIAINKRIFMGVIE